jgi:hypothetical protein
MTDNHRREFLRNGLALFGAALLPFKTQGQSFEPDEDLDPVLQEMKRQTEPHSFEAYAINEGCIIGLDQDDPKCLANEVTIVFPSDEQFLSRFPTDIQFPQLCGPKRLVEEILSVLGDISHMRDMFIQFPATEPGTVENLWRFHRPIITQVSMTVESHGMMIASGVRMMCAFVPERAAA